MTEKKEKGYTYHELMDMFFPNMVLNRLGKDVCGVLGSDEGWQSEVHKNKDDPKEGWVEVAYGYRFPLVEPEQAVVDRAVSFYKAEGWEVEHAEGSRVLTVRKKDKEYEVFIIGGEETVTVHVHSSPTIKE